MFRKTLLTASGAAVLSSQRRRFAAVRRREVGQLKEQRRRLCRRPPSAGGHGRPVSAEKDDVTRTDRHVRDAVHTVLVQSERADNDRQVPGTIPAALQPALQNPPRTDGYVEVGRRRVAGRVPDGAGVPTAYPGVDDDICPRGSRRDVFDAGVARRTAQGDPEGQDGQQGAVHRVPDTAAPARNATCQRERAALPAQRNLNIHLDLWCLPALQPLQQHVVPVSRRRVGTADVSTQCAYSPASLLAAARNTVVFPRCEPITDYTHLFTTCLLTNYVLCIFNHNLY